LAIPDFFNAPTHSLRIVSALHAEFPDLTYDVTIKVEHLRQHADLLPTLATTGCALVTTAVESIDDCVLERLDKRHSSSDLPHILELLRSAGLTVNPTFVAFTPWTSLEGYADLLQAVLRLRLVDHVAPVQYTIRLLIPAGSRLLALADVKALVREFDPRALAYPWFNPDPQVDRLHEDVVTLVQHGQQAGWGRRETFAAIWHTTSRLLGPGHLAETSSRIVVSEWLTPPSSSA
jgi:hypothetical protein